ncbi:MAG: hypothetical protein C4524_15460 [Candidatus Zixiibacteriota bacterium]|nr:MAG: hypothetical protein C4524_15460 [candidate division Zixibacteria bacterium]
MATAGIVIYYSGMNIDYYDDDYKFLYDHYPVGPLHFYTHSNPYNSFYHPLQCAAMVVLQNLFGYATWPVRIAGLIPHVLLAWIVYLAMLRLNFNSRQAMVGSLFMLISQANAFAILNNDTLSQVFGSFFGILCLWWLYLSLPEQDRPGRTRRQWLLYGLSLLALFLSLSSKESSVAYFPIALAVIFLHGGVPGKIRSWRRLSVEAGPFVIIMGLYLVARSHVVTMQPALGHGNYNFNFGLVMLKNLAMMFFEVLLPVSSVTTFVALKEGANLVLIPILAFTVIFASVTFAGLVKSPRRPLILVLIAFGTVGFFPMAAMNHISELYVYNAMAFFAMLVGIGFGGWLEHAASGVSRRLAVGLACLVTISNIWAVQHKSGLMLSLGRQSTALLQQAVSLASQVPSQGTLVLANPPCRMIEYSVYRIHGWELFHNATHRIRLQAGREDITVEIVDSTEAETIVLTKPAVVLDLEQGNVVVRPTRPLAVGVGSNPAGPYVP